MFQKLSFVLSPPVPKSSGHVSSIIIPQNKPTSVLVYPFKGHQDWTILSRNKGGVKYATNPETPCIMNHKSSFQVLATPTDFCITLILYGHLGFRFFLPSTTMPGSQPNLPTCMWHGLSSGSYSKRSRGKKV